MSLRLVPYTLQAVGCAILDCVHIFIYTIWNLRHYIPLLAKCSWAPIIKACS
jgi:hypothetical protein